MGATTFYTYIALPDAKRAFDESNNAAKRYYGRAGYTGTIAEKDEFVMVADKPLTEADAYELAGKLIDADDERVARSSGPAGAIPIKASSRHRKVCGWMFFGWAST